MKQIGGEKLKCQHCPKVFDRPGLRRVHEQVISKNESIWSFLSHSRCYSFLVLLIPLGPNQLMVKPIVLPFGLFPM